MSSGTFKLYSRLSGRSWGLLDYRSFDDAARLKAERREAVLDEIQLALVNWSRNCAQFRDADFCIEEQLPNADKPVHIQGVPRYVEGFDTLGAMRVPRTIKTGGIKRKPFNREEFAYA